MRSAKSCPLAASARSPRELWASLPPCPQASACPWLESDRAAPSETPGTATFGFLLFLLFVLSLLFLSLFHPHPLSLSRSPQGQPNCCLLVPRGGSGSEQSSGLLAVVQVAPKDPRAPDQGVGTLSVPERKYSSFVSCAVSFT